MFFLGSKYKFFLPFMIGGMDSIIIVQVALYSQQSGFHRLTARYASDNLWIIHLWGLKELKLL